MEEGGDCKQARFNASNKKQRKVADAVLAQMGFGPAEPLVNFKETSTATAKDGRKIVPTKDNGHAIAVGKTQIPLPDIYEIDELGFVPRALVIVHKVQTSSNMDGMGTWELEVTSVPTP